MTGIHDTLQKCRRYLLADRDCVYESVSLDDGTIPNPDDAKDVADIDALIDEVDAVLKQRASSNVHVTVVCGTCGAKYPEPHRNAGVTNDASAS